jgi:hypothetical protein
MTVEEIENSMIAMQADEPTLTGLDSPSKVAEYKLWRKIVAHAIKFLADLFDAKKIELQIIAANSRPGTEKWYATEMLKFQNGYALQERDGVLYYLIDDEAARIIKKVAVSSSSKGVLTIKLATETGGELVKLSTAQNVAAQSYLNAIKFAGTRTSLVSNDPDLVKVSAWRIYYDGKLNLDSFKTATTAAINSYLKNIFFNGKLNINRFRDAVEAVEGYVDSDPLTVLCKKVGGAYAPVLREYAPDSGYFNIDPAFPLSDAAQITYIAV